MMSKMKNVVQPRPTFSAAARHLVSPLLREGVSHSPGWSYGNHLPITLSISRDPWRRLPTQNCRLVHGSGWGSKLVQSSVQSSSWLYLSKSGLMNKHIVKHIGSCRVNAFWGALHPSKSGLMNKHIVKHIVKHLLCGSIFGALCPVPVQVRISEQTYRETYRLSPD